MCKPRNRPERPVFLQDLTRSVKAQHRLSRGAQKHHLPGLKRPAICGHFGLEQIGHALHTHVQDRGITQVLGQHHSSGHALPACMHLQVFGPHAQVLRSGQAFAGQGFP